MLSVLCVRTVLCSSVDLLSICPVSLFFVLFMYSNRMWFSVIALIGCSLRLCVWEYFSMGLDLWLSYVRVMCGGALESYVGVRLKGPLSWWSFCYVVFVCDFLIRVYRAWCFGWGSFLRQWVLDFHIFLISSSSSTFPSSSSSFFV